MLLVGLLLSLHVPSSSASNHTLCVKNLRGSVLVESDTLHVLALPYNMNWSALVAQGRNGNTNLVVVNRAVCIPVQGFSAGTQTKPIQPVTHKTAGTAITLHIASVKPRVKPTPPPVVTPVTSSPGTTPVTQPTEPPVVTAPPVAPPAPVAGSIPAMITQIFGAYGPGAINVARCESGLNPGAHNPSGASGLFQIMPGTWAGTSQAGSSPYNAQANAIAAHEIFVRDGYSWREWTCQP